MKNVVLALVAATALAGCSSVKEIGSEPVMSPVGSGLAPTLASTTATATYPEMPPQPVKRFSLWDDRQSHLFTDARALRQGDILTVEIALNDKAQFNNKSDRKRTQGRSIGLGASADVEGFTWEGSGDLDYSSSSTYAGDGATVRSEKLELRVAAVVTDILPNGNLIIRGSQEVRVNAEMRVLQIAGIVRPQDIGAANTIAYDRIAEARISYGGRGRITEVQQPTWGQQIVDVVSPL
jgi:flagellar L-ring protein precursor FlgH